MIRLLGSLCILGGGLLAVCQRQREDRRQRDTLRELVYVLRRMAEEIRMARTPLPRLLESLAETCGRTTAFFLLRVSRAARSGEGLAEVWQREADQLPLRAEEKVLLQSVNLQGDEEKICKELYLVTTGIAEFLEERERKKTEEVKRTSALWLSAAALLVILLI